jgi:hypothetical protein
LERRDLVPALPARFLLAATAWPRTGGGPRQAGRVAFQGPSRGRILHAIELPDVSDARGGGVAVDAGGRLIVVAGGMVFRVTLEGDITSRLAVPPALASIEPGADGGDAGVADDPAGEAGDEEDVAPPVRPRLHAAPVALRDGNAVVLAPPEVLVVGADGGLVARLHVGGLADDSGAAPNVTSDGALVLTYLTGEVELVRDGSRRPLGAFGYDVPPPALYPDDALAISGYYGTGLVAVATDGTRRWRSGLEQADRLPAIDAEGFAVAGSANDDRSIVVSPAGEVVGSIGVCADFAEAGGGDWIARSRDGVARYRRDGSLVWSAADPLAEGTAWGGWAAMVDRDDRVYVLGDDALAARDGRTGRELFRAALGERAFIAPALVAPGLAAVLVGRRLLLVG